MTVDEEPMKNSAFMVQCFNADDRRSGFVRNIEKVKFGVPVTEALLHDIPATLLVLLLRVNKLGPLKKDIWRAPGNQAHVRKLIHGMQHGHLKFLSKLPGGIFGRDNEERLFRILDLDDSRKKREAICRVISSLPVPSQHLLVLLFGTFRLICDSDASPTRMTPEAIGLSVAPSLFHTCIHDGHRARIEDVVRFRMASRVVTVVVENFGFSNLFPRENYEFYARMTGRTLRVEANWHFSFQYPSKSRCHTEEVTYELEAVRHEESSGFCCHRELQTAVSLEDVQQLMNQFAESTKSLSFLEWVHEKQIVRMQTRSEWFLSPNLAPKRNGDGANGGGVAGAPAVHRFGCSPLHSSSVAQKDVGSRSEIARRLSWRKRCGRRPSSTSNMYRLTMNPNSSLANNSSSLVPLLPRSSSQRRRRYTEDVRSGRRLSQRGRN